MKAASITVWRTIGIITIAGIAANPHTALSKTVTADTVVSSLLCQDSISYMIRQDSLTTKILHAVIGPVTISNAPAPVLGTALPFPSSSLDDTVAIPLSWIYRVVFDTTSPPLSVKVRNTSAATVSGLTIKIFDSVRSLATLGPNDSAILLFPVVGWDAVSGQKVGKAIDDSGAVGGSLPGVQRHVDSVSAAAYIEMTFNFNGLNASELSILSYYVSFSKSFVNPCVLSDTLDIYYIDILDGFFWYGINNYIDYRLQVNINQPNLWSHSFCAGHMPPLESAEDVAAGTTHTDSLFYYMGRNMSVLSVNSDSGAMDSTLVNLSADRLFPVWIYDSIAGASLSAAPMEYLTTPYYPAVARIVTIKATDSLTVMSAFRNFKYREMLATTRQEYVFEGDTLKVKVPSPWNASSKDSLGKNVYADISSTFHLPDSNFAQRTRAYFDTVEVQYTFFSPDSPAVKAVCSTKFVNVGNNGLFRQQVNITDLMDLWPDSIYIAMRITIPVGTRMMIVNELVDPFDPDYPNYMGRMNINIISKVNIYELTGVVTPGVNKRFNRMRIGYFNDKLIISIPESYTGPAELSIFSLSGRCIKRESFFGRGNTALPLGRKVARGVYSVFVGNRFGICREKIVVP
jgi:hypothetical protein